ncbi:MAG: hypothetical protein OEL20_00290 [Sulfuritalea sp.]|nr:hypothetical protein [Sulfuritalea sp.]
MNPDTRINDETGSGTASPAATAPAARRNGRLILLAIVAIGLFPLLAALYFRYVSPPEVKATVGRSLEPMPLPFELLRRADGAALEHPAVSGKWLLIFAAPGGCDERCRQTLYLTRQARTAQGRNVTRLDRFWLITDAAAPAADLMAAHPDLVPIKAADAKVLELLGGKDSRKINLVDRRGMLVFRYADDPEPKAFIRELGKLIKF